MAMRLAFSTLGCPGWTIEQVGESAARYGYEGVELRLLDGEILPADLPRDQRERIKRALAGVAIPCVDTSIRVATNDADAAARMGDDVEGYIQIANDLGAPLLRVFGGPLAEGDSEPAARDRAVQRLNELAPLAEKYGVGIALETHDSMSAGRVVADVLSRVPSRSIGALWDSHHPYRMGESPEETLELLGDRVLLTHVKDARRQGDGWQLVPLSHGEVPVQAMLAALAHKGWDGWISLEWEKKWHPELAEPEEALPFHAETLRRYLDGLTA